jgi:PEGA domain
MWVKMPFNRRLFALGRRSLCCCLLVLNTSAAQQQTVTPPASAGPVVKPALAFGLDDATPVHLKTTQAVSSADAQVGNRVEFAVVDEVKVKDLVVIPKDGIAWATITEAQPKRRLGRAGKLAMTIDTVRLVDGERIPLRAVKENQGGSHVGVMTGAMVATGILFFPAAPLFLFMHGKDITIPVGSEVTAFVNGDVPLDRAKFDPAALQPQSAPPADAATAPASANAPPLVPTAAVTIKSTPGAADILVNDRLVGTTPSTLKLAPGEVKVRIEKAGFQPWERTLTLTPGSEITVDATLTASP